MTKRILTLALCLALTLGMAAPVYATETPPAADGVEVTVTPGVSGETPRAEPVEDPAQPEETPAQPTENPGESEPPAPTKPKSPGDVSPPAETEPPEPTEVPAPELCEHGKMPSDCEQCLALARNADLYAALMAAESLEEIEALLAPLTEEEAAAFMETITEEQYAALEARIAELRAQDTELPSETVDFTDAGPLMPPVEMGVLSAQKRLFTERAQDNGLELTKSAVKDGNDYKICLEAYTTGSVTIETTTTPLDIVMVLDQSGSMVENFDGGNTRQKAMQEVVKKFIDEVSTRYSANQSDHRIALVTFADKGKSREIAGFTETNTTGTISLKSKIDSLGTPSGATYINDGMERAYTLFKNDTRAGTRIRVVIVFTDGMPGTGHWYTIFLGNDDAVADATIGFAKNIKAARTNTNQGGGATVYTIGIFNGANGQIVPPYEDVNGTSSDTVKVRQTNRFLHLVSSNFPGASNRQTSGTQNSNGLKYYLTASNTDKLNEIFQTITNQIGSANINLGPETEIRDIVSDYFDITDNAANITLKIADYNGTAFGPAYVAPSGITANVNQNTKTVKVTGFDFNANFISPTPKSDKTYGKKLIIEFTVTPKAEFWGGDNVPTNVFTSGVYGKDSTLVEAFDIPAVNVPLNVPNFTGNTVNVHYGGTAPGDSSLYAPLVKPTGGDAWKAAFVTLGSYAVTGGPERTTVDGATYTISMTASSESQTQLKTATATIHVFLPQFAVAAWDVWADCGVAVPLAQWGLVQDMGTPGVAVTWMRDGAASTSLAMANSAPAISNYKFIFNTGGAPAGDSYTTGELDADFNVGLSSCTVGGTAYTVPSGALTVTKAVDSEGHDFTVHINKFQMTIEKTFSGASVYQQDCIFTVTSGSSSFRVVIPVGSKTKTVVGLVCGKTYTVTEDGSWSWRYTASGSEPVTCTHDTISNGPPVESSTEDRAVKIVNDPTYKRWLSGNDMKSNLFEVAKRRRAKRGEG